MHALVHELAKYERAADEVTSTPDDFAAALFADRPTVHCHVVEVDGAVVGFAQWFVTFSTWTGRNGIWLDDLYVQAHHRGGGYGTALLAELAALAVARGWSRVEWWVLDWNAPAVDFYRRIGARPMADWTCQRLDGEALAALAERAGRPQRAR